MIEVLLLLLVAGVAGAVGQAIVGYSRGGCLVSIALGFIGAFIGILIARALGLPSWLAVRIGSTTFPVLWAIIGAALFVALVARLRGRRA